MKLISIKTLFSLKSLRKKLFFNMLGLAALTMLISLTIPTIFLMLAVKFGVEKARLIH